MRGCGFDLSFLVGYIAKYIGWIMIIGGLIMTFNGANFIVYGISFMVFLASTFMAFFFLVNIGIIHDDPRNIEGDEIPWLLFGLMILCLIFGSVCSYFTKKLVEKYSVLLLGACGGGMIVFFIMDRIDCENYIKLLVTVVGALLGGYLC